VVGQDDESLTYGEFFVVSKEMRHSPVPGEESRILLIETVTTAHTRTAVTDRTVSVERQMGMRRRSRYSDTLGIRFIALMRSRAVGT